MVGWGSIAKPIFKHWSSKSSNDHERSGIAGNRMFFRSRVDRICLGKNAHNDNIEVFSCGTEVWLKPTAEVLSNFNNSRHVLARIPSLSLLLVSFVSLCNRYTDSV